MIWHAQPDIDYALEHGRTVARHRHNGPLRVLQSLYPEGEAVCHDVPVHPPGGLVGGDTPDLTVTAGDQAHALLTTPGVIRFYRSAAEPAVQRASLTLHDQARLEWLPLEAIAYDACRAENQLQMRLAAQAELLGRDITALPRCFLSAAAHCQEVAATAHWRWRVRTLPGTRCATALA